MSTHVEEHIDLCAGHALRSLDERNQRRLLEHLADGCDACESALEGYEAAALLVARGAPLTLPSPTLRARVLSDALLAVGGHAERPRDLARPRPGGGGGIAAGTSWTAVLFMFLALASAAVSAFLYTEVRRLRTEGDDTRLNLGRVSAEMVDAKRWEDVLTGRDSRVVPLLPGEAAGAAMRAEVFYDPVTHRAVLAGTGFAAPAGQRLVAWSTRAGRPVALGGFLPDAAGRGLLRVPDTGETATLTRFFVTLEHQDGALPAAPTGRMVAQGALTR